MDNFVVFSKPQLVAAIKAGAQSTWEAAKANPFIVKLGTQTFTFKDGLHERRAKYIIRNIHATPASAFKVQEV